jgi:hypothetical protein
MQCTQRLSHQGELLCMYMLTVAVLVVVLLPWVVVIGSKHA